MYITVNKKTTTRRPVKYAALNSALNAATSSGIWHNDDDVTAQATPRRTNRIRLTRAKSDEAFDA